MKKTLGPSLRFPIKNMNRKTSFYFVRLSLSIAVALLIIPMTGYATEQGEERRQAKEIEQKEPQESRKTQTESRVEDEKTSKNNWAPSVTQPQGVKSESMQPAQTSEADVVENDFDMQFFGDDEIVHESTSSLPESDKLGHDDEQVVEEIEGANSAAAKLRRLYSYSYTVAAGGANAPQAIKAGATNHAVWAAFRELRRCFNCSFPIKGAPKKYPRPAQLLKLKPLNIKGPVKFYPEERLSGWHFVAQRGHFDGAGSTVSFRFWEDNQNRLKLSVVADVAHPRIPDVINRNGARIAWGTFARRLGNNMKSHQGCRPNCK